MVQTSGTKNAPFFLLACVKKGSWIIKTYHVSHHFLENNFTTDFREKAEFFYSFFVKQCSLINSDSSLPSELIKKSFNYLYSVRFSTVDKLNIINNLDSMKGHDQDEVSIRMLQYLVPLSVDHYKLFISLV